MSVTHQDFARRTIDPNTLPLVSDDECLIRLATAVEHHDDDKLHELAQLIGRLAIPIEL